MTAASWSGGRTSFWEEASTTGGAMFMLIVIADLSAAGWRTAAAGEGVKSATSF
jgi:hypothetical protein